jgi:hypothetical protein
VRWFSAVLLELYSGMLGMPGVFNKRASDLMADETSTIVPPRLSNGLVLSVTATVPNTLTAYTSWNKWVMTAALQWGVRVSGGRS